MATFDFHFHPVFKQFLCEFEASYPSRRNAAELSEPIDFKNPLTDALDDVLHVLESQSCLAQLDEGQLHLGVANIAPMEQLFTSKEGIFGMLLNSRFFTNPVDQTYMNKVRNGEISYYQLFLRELSLFRQLQSAGKLTFLTRQNASALTAGTGPKLTLAMEGGHSLCRTLVGRPGKVDSIAVAQSDALVDDFIKNPALDPARSLEHLQRALWSEGLDLFSLVITHLSHIPEQLIATHAFGLKMLKDEAAYPLGDGITPAGKRLIDKAYTLKLADGTPAPVLLDIKHMSLKSRRDFYAYRREKGYTTPLIASHMGVTGYAVEEWKSALEEAHLVRLKASNAPVVRITTSRRTAGEWGAINKVFTYNPWTINLMDEDIEEVLKSNGLIGMSLDVRILGWQDALSKGEKEEFMSAEEFRVFFPDQYKKLSTQPLEAAESFLVPTKEERHPLALCFNILHIVSVGKLRLGTDQAWGQITLGSDFDGLISAVVNCRNAGQVPGLEAVLLRWLPVAEERYRKENGGLPLLKRKVNGDIDEASLRQIVRGILHDNGERFLKKWAEKKL